MRNMMIATKVGKIEARFQLASSMMLFSNNMQKSKTNWAEKADKSAAKIMSTLVSTWHKLRLPSQLKTEEK